MSRGKSSVTNWCCFCRSLSTSRRQSTDRRTTGSTNGRVHFYTVQCWRLWRTRCSSRLLHAWLRVGLMSYAFTYRSAARHEFW